MRPRIQQLDMTGIRKEFSGFLANDDISLSLSAGEILGLLGENGAGKSTLMNILFGLYQADAGTISVNGRPCPIASPRDALRAGIGMVHQHFMLIPTHTVLENIALSMPSTSFFDPLQAAREKIALFRERYDLTIREQACIWELSAGEQQRVEILKSLSADVDVLVLDEPTSVLTPVETEELFSILRKLTADGRAVIFISHKLDEIMRMCQRVQVLRRGKAVGCRRVAETSAPELARLMVGHELPAAPAASPATGGETLLAVENLCVDSDMKVSAVGGVSFDLRRGEVLGVAGISGNGQRELIEALTGLRSPREGTLTLDGKAFRPLTGRECFQAGIAHIPEERLRFGIVSTFSSVENAILKDYFTAPVSRFGLIDHGLARQRAERIIAEYQVVPADADQPLGRFSGGNIQKFLVGRELDSQPRLIIASHPTYGVDIGAAQCIRSRLLAERERGAGILLVSEDLEEIFSLSDRIAVMFAGTFMGVFPRAQADRGTIGLMMAGVRPDPKAAS